MRWLSLTCTLLIGTAGLADDSATTAAARGEKALTTQAFVPASWSSAAYRKAWTRWPNTPAAPKDYAQAFRTRYGLHEPTFVNGELPLGLRTSRRLLGQGVGMDCLLCHAGSIFGKTYLGLGNSTFDLQGLVEDLAAADGKAPQTPFRFANVRGTSEAGALSVFLLQYRQPSLALRLQPVDLEVHDNMCEDAPAWWLLKKKKTMYHTGNADARSVRSLMQFMMHPLNSSADFAKAESTFRDIQAYLLSLPPPKYPLPIDTGLAKQGEALFLNNCAKCHGKYGSEPSYPNRVVKLDEIGTDPARLKGITQKFYDYYDNSWFAEEKAGWFSTEYRSLPAQGYQAPPLDGVWATAPYLHNGSVPTLYDVLNTKSRPTRYTRSFRTDREDYDAKKVGWRVTHVPAQAGSKLLPDEERKIYDTSLPGRRNTGHAFGDALSEPERWAVIEYLKTL